MASSYQILWAFCAALLQSQQASATTGRKPARPTISHAPRASGSQGTLPQGSGFVCQWYRSHIIRHGPHTCRWTIRTALDEAIIPVLWFCQQSCPLPWVLIRVYKLLACGLYPRLIPPLVMPNHSTALTTADGGYMDFASVAGPWSSCFSLFAWPGLQPLASLPAQHAGDESPLKHHLAQSHFSNICLAQPGYVALARYPMWLSFSKCSCISTSCSAWICGISRIPRCSWAPSMCIGCDICYSSYSVLGQLDWIGFVWRRHTSFRTY